MAVTVANEYKVKTGDKRPMVIASTASPYKFTKSVLKALGEEVPEDEFEASGKLSAVTGVPVPSPIANLCGKKVRFAEVIDKSAIKDAVYSSLNM